MATESDVIASLLRLKSALLVAALEASAKRFADALKYSSDQPRDELGRWIEGSTNEATARRDRALRLAQVIRICIASGISRSFDKFGNKIYKAIYECPGGQTITQQGYGHSPRGFIIDPFR